jgi:hypothetical protein
MLLRVMPACFSVVFFRVTGVTMRGVSVVSGLFVVASFMVLGCFLVMLGRMLMMLGGFSVMFNSLLTHLSLPVHNQSLIQLSARPDRVLTMVRNICNATGSPRALQTGNAGTSARAAR